MGIKIARKRHLDQDAVGGRIVSQPRDPLMQPGLGDLMEMLDRRVEANLLGRPVLSADVGRRRRVVTDMDDGDPWRALVGMALDSEFQFLADGPRVGAAVDQASRHRLSLLRQIADLDGPRDLDGKGVEVGKGWAFADAHRHLDHGGLLQNGTRDPLGHRLEEVRGLALEDFPGGLLKPGIADGFVDAVAGSGPLGVENHLEVSGKGLAELPLGWVVAVVAEGSQAREDEATGWPRPFCRHVLTNIPNGVMMPK